MPTIAELTNDLNEIRKAREIAQSDMRILRMFRLSLSHGVSKEDIIFDLKRLTEIIPAADEVLKALE